MVAILAVLLACASQQLTAEPVGAPEPFTKAFITRHEGTFGGQKIQYTATLKSTVLTDERGRPSVSLVSTDYVRTSVKGRGKRPVIFVWGGGPGVPSMYFHMYLLGPHRIAEAGSGKDQNAPKLVENPDALLDSADFVFVDPAETGFSRILASDKRAYYYSIEGDAQATIELMERWLQDHGRQDSPRYLLGSSYGSVRAIRIASELVKTRPVDGIIVTANSAMVQETERVGGIIGYAAGLPTMALTAVYHGLVDRRGRSDREIADEAYDFAMNEYLPALATAQDLPAAKRESIARRLHAITAISQQSLLDNDLAIARDDFRNNVLKDRGLTLTDPYDARRTDAASNALVTPEPLKDYFSRQLGVTYPMSEYVAFAPGVREWDFRAADGSPGNDWPTMLRRSMEANPRMRVLSANGYYDMLSTIGQVRYLMSRTKLPRDRVAVREYPGGHTLYLEPSTAKALLADIRQFLTAH